MLGEPRRYWWIFAGEFPALGAWLTVVIGPSEYALPPEEQLESGARWVQTLNHHPTDAEISAHTPEEYEQ